YNDLIYVVCAMNGRYPVEEPLSNVWIYDPASDEWTMGGEIPAEHQRGGGGAVLYDGKIYVACGIDLCHTSGTSNLFSCYDPESGEWSTLTKAPHIRDHFAAIVVDDKLYCIGGRNSSYHNPDKFGVFFNATVGEVDVYDFTQERWYTLANQLPVPTAAGGVVALGGEIIYMGGEGSDSMAYSQTQCLNIESGEWRQLSPMVEGMHGSGAIIHNDIIYWAAGSYKQGGSNLNTLQRFAPR
ncbi:MAG: kelch repeat-containing protein, partial [Rikenellaceae bacterium]